MLPSRWCRSGRTGTQRRSWSSRALGSSSSRPISVDLPSSTLDAGEEAEQAPPSCRAEGGEGVGSVGAGGHQK